MNINICNVYIQLHIDLYMYGCVYIYIYIYIYIRNESISDVSSDSNLLEEVLRVRLGLAKKLDCQVFCGAEKREDVVQCNFGNSGSTACR